MDKFLLSKKKSICVTDLFGEEVLDLSTPKKKMETFTRLFEKMLSVEHIRKESLVEEMPKILGVEEEYQK